MPGEGHDGQGRLHTWFTMDSSRFGNSRCRSTDRSVSAASLMAESAPLDLSGRRNSGALPVDCCADRPGEERRPPPGDAPRIIARSDLRVLVESWRL